jgi:hypothetical protein
MRDYDYVHTCVQRRKDPFIVTSKRMIDRVVLDHALSKISPAPLDFSLLPSLETEAEPIGDTRLKAFEAARLKKFITNFGMAAIGGGFLVAPMWLMVLHNTVYTTLATTTVCVSLFGVIMSWRLGGPMEVLSVTAAYAAVLVVFVGANTGKGGLVASLISNFKTCLVAFPCMIWFPNIFTGPA